MHYGAGIDLTPPSNVAVPATGSVPAERSELPRGSVPSGRSGARPADASEDHTPAKRPTSPQDPQQPNLPDRWDEAWGSWRFWLVLVLTGIGAGIGAGVLMAILHGVQHLAYDYRRGPFQAAADRTSGQRRVLVMAGAGLLLGGSWFFLRKLAGPGRGLSEAVWAHAGHLPFVRTLVNGVLQIVAVALGATLGREGAPKETGAAIASRLSQAMGLDRGQRRLLVACGAGAGMAAVYNVPLGGALFALEVLLGTVSLPLVVPALGTAAIATAVSWLLLPDRATYLVPHVTAPDTVVVWAVVIGPVAGVLGAGYIWLIGRAKAAKPDGWRLVPSIFVAFVVVGAVAVAYPQVLGNGKDLTQLLLVARLGLPVVGAVVVIRPLATAVFLRNGAEGGLFTPTLAFGALFGTIAGHGWNLLWPGGAAAAYTMIGAAALLASAMESPLASIALVVELTHSGLDLVVPITLAVAGSIVVCRRLQRWSIYTVGAHEHHSARAQRGMLGYLSMPGAGGTAGVGGTAGTGVGWAQRWRPSGVRRADPAAGQSGNKNPPGNENQTGNEKERP